MLKLKGPIQLKTSGLRLSAASESFCQRLTGNYELMTARVAPKDLLFLLTAPPELPEDLGGGASLNLANSYTDIRNVTVDVVNHVVNRILLDGRANFTYQDQVYITTVLRKLGVTDVSRFMEEVRRLRDEQRLQRELTRLYRQETTRKALALLHTEEKRERTGREEGQAAERPSASATRYYLHQEIYRRLETGDIYQEVASFQQNMTRLGDSVERNELRLSEQLRISRDLKLEELKQRNVYGGAVALHHHINRYEQGDLLPPPENEKEVLAQAAQAALLSMVDQVATQTLERQSVWREPWLNLSQSLSQTAENTLNRFESYLSQRNERYYAGADDELWYQGTLREELTALRQITEAWESREHLTRELRFSKGQGGDVPAAASMEHPVYELPWELPGPGPAGADGVPGRNARELTSMRRLMEGWTNREELLRERSVTEGEQPTEFSSISMAHPVAAGEESKAESGETAEGKQPSGPATHELASMTREILSRSLKKQETLRLQGIESTYSETVPTRKEQEKPQIVLEHTAPVPAERADPALLERELREIDRQNRERYERIQAIQRQRTREVVLRPPDQRRTMADSLRALERPELVLRELAEERESVQPAGIPAEVERILSQTDPVTRQVYETLIRYQNDPAAVLAEGLVQPGNIGAFNAQAARQEAEGRTLEHRLPVEGAPGEEAQRPHPGAGALDYLRELPQRAVPIGHRPGEWGKTPIVLRREDYSAMEELVERLEEQRVQTGVRQAVREEVSHQSLVQTEVHDQTRQMVAHTTEDITELVNRTMARQMNTLTEKVYRQMERKLQSERSRRGRF